MKIAGCCKRMKYFLKTDMFNIVEKNRKNKIVIEMNTVYYDTFVRYCPFCGELIKVILHHD